MFKEHSRKNYVRDVDIFHKYIIPSSKPFENLKTSLATKIMLASQFVDFLEHTRC
jgi:hypothetical protein